MKKVLSSIAAVVALTACAGSGTSGVARTNSPTEISRSTADAATACFDGWYVKKLSLSAGAATWSRGVATTIAKQCNDALSALAIDEVGVPKGPSPIHVLGSVLAEIAWVATVAECVTPSCPVKKDALDLRPVWVIGADAFMATGASGNPGLSGIPGLNVRG